MNNTTPFFSIPIPYVGLTLSRQTLMAIAVVWAFAFVPIRGVRPGRVMSNVLATLKVTALNFQKPFEEWNRETGR